MNMQKDFHQRRAPFIVAHQSSSCHYVSLVFSVTFSAPCFVEPLRVLTLSSVPFEYPCTTSRAELVLVCTVFYTLLTARTTSIGTLATCERACQAVCSLACCFAEWVLACAANEVADALLELERVGLVGGWDLVNLVWSALETDMDSCEALCDAPLAT